VKSTSEENLLGYVLGALDATETRDIDRHLELDPALEDRLLEIKTSLAPLDCMKTAGPRPGLARRTCEMVASNRFDPPPSSSTPAKSYLHQAPGISETINDQPEFTLRSQLLSSQTEAAHETTHPSTATVDVGLPATRSRRVFSETRTNLMRSTWSFNDFAAGVACLAILSSILFPALSYTRYHGRVAACKNNLQQLAGAFLQYSDIHDGSFIEVPHSGSLAASGCFGPILKDAGLITNDAVLNCAGFAATNRTTKPMHIPTVATLQRASGDELLSLQRSMGGHYGYTMGYTTKSGYVPPRNLGRTNVVLVADMPSQNLPGRRSANHSGRGQNGLFEDGHVQFIAGDSIGEDAIFLNDYNLVAPGCRAGDNVIAPSHLSPNLPR